MPKNVFWFIAKKNSDTAEVYIYGDIGYEVKAGDFIAELRELSEDYANVDVHINTNGGSIFEGIAIYNAMLRSKANIETYVDGLAASMGSIIMLGGKKVHMSKAARVMTHRASGIGCGTPEDLRNTADMMEGLEGTIAEILAAKTGLTADEAKAKYITNQDRWLNAEQALAEKLVDSIYDAEAPAPALPENATVEQVWTVYKDAFTNHFINNSSNMKKVTLSITPELAMLLALPNNGADTDEAQFTNSLKQLSERAQRADGLASQVTNLKTEKDSAVQELATFKKTTSATQVKAMLDDSLQGKKITVELHKSLGEDYAENPDGLKKILAGMNAYVPLVDNLKKAEENVPDNIKGKTFMELHREDKLESVKTKFPEFYKKIEKEWKDSKD